MGHHGDVRAPFPLQADEDAHADAVDAGLAHAVEAVQPPFELGLHAPRMIDVVVGRGLYVSWKQMTPFMPWRVNSSYSSALSGMTSIFRLEK